jgi:hypothetical protein
MGCFVRENLSFHALTTLHGMIRAVRSLSYRIDLNQIVVRFPLAQSPPGNKGHADNQSMARRSRNFFRVRPPAQACFTSDNLRTAPTDGQAPDSAQAHRVSPDRRLRSPSGPLRNRRKRPLRRPILHTRTKPLQRHHKPVASTGRTQACAHFRQQEISMLQCYGLAPRCTVGERLLPQRSQGSGGVREAFLRRSAGRNGTCTRTEPSGPQDRMRTQAEPPGLRGGCS